MWTGEGGVRAALARARDTVRTDLRQDPSLAYILLVSVLFCGFWLRHRAPTVATWDERDRLLDALVAYGSVVSDPGFGGLREGVTWGRTPFGGTFADLLSPGIAPQSDRYGDEQELAGRQSVVMSERTGACDGQRSPPW